MKGHEGKRRETNRHEGKKIDSLGKFGKLWEGLGNFGKLSPPNHLEFSNLQKPEIDDITPIELRPG